MFVLGAMLPDFAGMAGARLSRLAEDQRPLSRGVALHHRTDHVFHASPIFLRLMQRTMERLTSAGVSRGSARAVGHIGVELLFDGELLGRGRGDFLGSAYLEALRAAEAVEAAVFRDPGGLNRFRSVHRRLFAHGIPHDYRNIEAVATRLAQILRGRPRLELTADGERAVRDALGAAQDEVAERAESLIDTLETALLAA